jgi:hypothetical protein
MADTSRKKKVAAKPKEPESNPKYSEMVGKAIAALKERIIPYNVHEYLVFQKI